MFCVFVVAAVCCFDDEFRVRVFHLFLSIVAVRAALRAEIDYSSRVSPNCTACLSYVLRTYTPTYGTVRIGT